MPASLPAPFLLPLLIVSVGLVIAPSWALSEPPKDVPGTTLPSAAMAPGLPGPSDLPQGTLEAAVVAFEADDLDLARRELEIILDRRAVPTPVRTRAQFLLGWVSIQLENHQQASASFYRVRKLKEHPLREMATYLEAESDRRRGHGRTAIEECDGYFKEFPEGRFADDCRLTQAHAFADIGKLGESARRFQAFLDKNPSDQRAEAISLRVASAYEALGRRDDAARRYRQLFIHHRLPSTGRVAGEGLRRLEAAGAETAPLKDMDLYTRACSLRRTGQFQASYDLFCELDERHPASGEGATSLGKRLQDERHNFLWRNRRYHEVGRWNASQYDKEPGAADAVQRLHWAVQGYSRSGYFKEAVKYQEIGLAKFPKSSRFRGKEEKSALLYIAAGEYAKARTAYQAWQKRSGRAKRSSEIRFYVSYLAYRAGDNETAVAGFTEFVKSRSSYRTAAFWYRSKAYDKLGKADEAKADRKTVVERDPDDWYALLVRDRNRRDRLKKRRKTPPVTYRVGRWPGERPRDVPPPAPPAPPTSESIVRLLDGLDREPGLALPEVQTREVEAVRRDADGRILAEKTAPQWPTAITPSAGLVVPATVRPTASVEFDPSAIPTTWRPSPYWNEKKGAALWKTFSETNTHLWEDLPRAYELSLIGLGEQAGALLADVFAEAKKVRRSKKIRRRVARWKAAEAKKKAAEAKKKAAEAKKKAEPTSEATPVPKTAEAAQADTQDTIEGKPLPPEEARWAAILDLDVKNKDWMAIFAAAGSPPGVSDFAVNSIPYGKLPRSTGPEIAASWTMTYPAAYAPHVWKHSRANNVDPLLMLSIMRAESLFRHDAVSRAGALGLVQVMPATGSKVAAMAGMDDFRVERLLDPAVNIELGTFYLGRLLERYDGQFALAVGSYNGGPHNVGRWLRGKVGMPYDEFVEEIAFDETRGYIKKVTEFYAIYLDLYAEGALPEMPLKTVVDDPSIIDF